MLRRSNRQDLPRLKQLWQDCFGDPAGYIDLYFTHYWQPDRLFVLEADGAPRAMCAWFGFLLAGQPAAYFYAVATDPAYQGRGFCRQLMAYAEQELAKQGIDSYLLVPGSRRLFDFYARMGYETAGSIGSIAITTGQPGPVCELTPDAYLRRRSSVAPGNAVGYTPEQLAYQSALCQFSGGGLYSLGGQGCAVAERTSESSILVKEALGIDPVLAGQYLLHHLQAEQAVVRFPADSGRPFCMGKNLVTSPCYLGLAFD